MYERGCLNEKTRLVGRTNHIDDHVFFPAGFTSAVDRHCSALSSCNEGFAVLAATPGSGDTVAQVIDNASLGEFHTVVIGRHDHADTAVLTDRALSLRHAMVILNRDASGCPFIRVLDLRSMYGIQDRDGRSHLSLAANGPVALRMADTAFFILPLSADGGPRGLGSADLSFNAVTWTRAEPYIPEDDVENHLKELSDVTHTRSAVSVVTEVKGVGERTGTPGKIGHLELRAAGRSYTRAVDQHALRAGMLLGRYERCDVNENHIDMPRAVSRVHALLLIIDGCLYAIDTGSINGIEADDEIVHRIALSKDRSQTLDLGGMEVKWVPADVFKDGQ